MKIKSPSASAEFARLERALESYPPILGSKEVAEITGHKLSSIHQMNHHGGDLPRPLRNGKSRILRFCKKDLIDYMVDLAERDCLSPATLPQPTSRKRGRPKISEQFAKLAVAS